MTEQDDLAYVYSDSPETQEFSSDEEFQQWGDALWPVNRTGFFKNNPGRIKNGLNEFLESFFSLGKNSFKRDNIRTKLVRAHKKLMKKVITDCKAAKGLSPDQIKPTTERRRASKGNSISMLGFFGFNDHHELSIWRSLVRIYLDNRDELDSLIKPGFRPFSSFNTSFFKAYFANEAVWTSFNLFLDLIFMDRHPCEYTTLFAVRCCDVRRPHGKRCEVKWRYLHSWFSRMDFWTINDHI